MSDILTINSAILKGREQSRQIIEKQEIKFNRPMIEAQIKAAWLSVPEEAKQYLKPEQVRKFDKKYGGV